MGREKAAGKVDLNADLRDVLQSLREEKRFPSIPKLAEAAGVSPSQLNRMLAYPEGGGANLETASRVIEALGMDPLSFLLVHERYAARAADPLATELRRILTPEQFKEAVDMAGRLRRLGALEATFAAIRAVLRALPKKD